MSRSAKSDHLVVGVDVGGTNMQFGVVDGSSAIVGRSKLKTNAAEGVDAVVSRIVTGMEQACAQAGVTPGEIGAVGVAAAGAIDIPNGVILDAPNLGWINLPLRDMLAAKLKRRIILENDVNAAVWGEYMLGSARGGGDVLGVWIGTGVGGGLVLNGRIYYGEFFTAGEIGHTVLDIRGEQGRRIVEQICSRTGMSRTILSRLGSSPDSILRSLIDPGDGAVSTSLLKVAYLEGDELTVDVVNEAARLLGIAIANWVTVLSLGRVILGGGVTEDLGEPWVQSIRRSFDETVFPERLRACRIVATELKDNAGLLGAALLARDAITEEADRGRPPLRRP